MVSVQAAQEQWERAIRRSDRLSLIYAWEAIHPHPCPMIICKPSPACEQWAEQWAYVWNISFECLKKALDSGSVSVLDFPQR